jgi:SAM-dependent methyltransferase
MSNWTSGYVTDLGYVHGFYRELTPTILSFAALLNGFAGPDPNAPLAYCELGCGQGFSANLIAAANPHIDVHATDFNPVHVHGASFLAMMAGTKNVQFYDDSFADFSAQPDLPDFDMIVLHGIYSWISTENRRHIIDFIRKKLKVGGLVYVSYNALPGWASLMPLRRLMIDQSGDSARATALRVQKAIEFLGSFAAANPHFLATHTTAKNTVEAFKQPTVINYIAHEYFNADLTPFYHADVVSELGDAKVTYVGSAAILENLEGASLMPEHAAFLQKVPTRLEKETLRDFLVNQQFRRDIFVRGPLPISFIESEFHWNRQRFILSVPRAEIEPQIKHGRGEVGLRPEVLEPLADALADGPRTVAQLFTNPKVRELPRQAVLEALAALVGVEYVQPALDEATEQDRVPTTQAFNLAVMSTAKVSNDLQFLASPITGGAIHVDRISQLFLLARRVGRAADATRFAWDTLRSAGTSMLKDGGAVCETPEENLAELEKKRAAFESRELPILTSLGIS